MQMYFNALLCIPLVLSLHTINDVCFDRPNCVVTHGDRVNCTSVLPPYSVSIAWYDSGAYDGYLYFTSSVCSKIHAVSATRSYCFVSSPLGCITPQIVNTTGYLFIEGISLQTTTNVYWTNTDQLTPLLGGTGNLVYPVQPCVQLPTRFTGNRGELYTIGATQSACGVNTVGTYTTDDYMFEESDRQDFNSTHYIYRRDIGGPLSSCGTRMNCIASPMYREHIVSMDNSAYVSSIPYYVIVISAVVPIVVVFALSVPYLYLTTLGPPAEHEE